MLDFLKNNPLIEGARSARLRPRMAAQLLIFFLVMTVADMIVNVPVSFYATVRMMSLIDPSFLAGTAVDQEALLTEMEKASAVVMAEDAFRLLSLFATAAVILVSLLYCRLIERRPIASMGVTLDRKSPLSFALGLLFGLAMLGGVYLVLYATGAVTLTVGTANVGMITLYLAGYLIQGSAEEFLYRGYLMPSLCNATSPLSSVLFSALFFSLMHASNPGFTLIAGLNIFLFGTLLGFLVLRTRNIWIACGLHAAWNFAEGTLFGMSVSGTEPGQSVLLSPFVENRTLTNGGAFGPEGGVATSLVLVAALIVFFYLPQKKKSGDSNENTV